MTDPMPALPGDREQVPRGGDVAIDPSSAQRFAAMCPPRELVAILHGERRGYIGELKMPELRLPPCERRRVHFAVAALLRDLVLEVAVDCVAERPTLRLRRAEVPAILHFAFDQPHPALGLAARAERLGAFRVPGSPDDCLVVGLAGLWSCVREWSPCHTPCHNFAQIGVTLHQRHATL